MVASRGVETAVDQRERRRFLLFVAAGAFAAVVNVLTRAALTDLGGYITYRSAVILAYIVGMATAFTLNKFVVFERSGKPVYEEVFWFTVVNVIGVVQVWCVSVGLAEYCFPRWNFNWHPQLVAHVIGVTPLAVTSYLGHKLLSFARKRASRKGKMSSPASVLHLDASEQ